MLRFFLFPYIARLLTRLYSFAPFLQNTISLNTASYLHAVHGSFIPFLLTFYGRPSCYMHCLNAASFLLLHSPLFPLYPSGLWYYKHRLFRASHTYLFK